MPKASADEKISWIIREKLWAGKGNKEYNSPVARFHNELKTAKVETLEEAQVVIDDIARKAKVTRRRVRAYLRKELGKQINPEKILEKYFEIEEQSE